MMKQCEKCGRDFDAREERHKLCPRCNAEQRGYGGGRGGGGGSINKIQLPTGLSASASSSPTPPVGLGRPPGSGSGEHPQAGRTPSSSRYGSEHESLPPECIFTTFLDAEGYFKRAIYIEAAETAAQIFIRERMTQASIRRLFNMLKQASTRLKLEKDFGAAQQVFYEFVRLVVYNNNRRGDKGPIIPDVFKLFVDKHIGVSTSAPKEFEGFVEYLTSIMAYMKQK